MSADSRVLILDDDAMVGLLVETIVRLDGAQARLTAAVADFLDAVESWQPTHVVVDLNLGPARGEDVLARLAERGSTARVVLVSGSEPERLDAAARTARDGGLAVAGVLVKPFRPAALRALLAGTEG